MIFEKVGIRDIGRYLSQRLGSPLLKIGTVLLVLSLLGKIPVKKLRLKYGLKGHLSHYEQILGV